MFSIFQFPSVCVGNSDLLHLIVSSIDGTQVGLVATKEKKQKYFVVAQIFA